MERYLRKYGGISIILSMILAILALFLIFRPEASITIVMRIIAIILLITGIVHVISYFSSSKEFKSISIELIEGIISIILGIIILVNPIAITSLLPIIIGCWILIQSIFRMQIAFNLKAADSSNWKVVLLLSILNLILGIVILFNPFASLVAITTICGIMLLVTEIINIVESISIMLKLN